MPWHGQTSLFWACGASARHHGLALAHVERGNMRRLTVAAPSFDKPRFKFHLQTALPEQTKWHCFFLYQ